MALTDEGFDELMAAKFVSLIHAEGTMDQALADALPGLSEHMRGRLFAWTLAITASEGTGDPDIRIMLAFAMGVRIGALIAPEL